MRHATILAIIAALAFGCGGETYSESVGALAENPLSHDCRETVFGDAQTDDVSAVQAAVDGGGTVCLVGEFDFGDDTPENPSRTVYITNGVTLLGEAELDNRGRAVAWHTRITGGSERTHFEPHDQYRDNGAIQVRDIPSGEEVVIKYLWFDRPRYAAVLYNGYDATEGNEYLEFSNNKITNTSFGWGLYYDGLPHRYGIAIFGIDPWTSVPGLIQGEVILNHNRIELLEGGIAANTYPDQYQVYAHLDIMAIFPFGTSADYEMVGNYIDTNHGVGIDIVNRTDQHNDGEAYIVDNYIRSERPISSFSRGPIYIEDNELVVDHIPFQDFSMGHPIILKHSPYSGGGTIRGNDITMTTLVEGAPANAAILLGASGTGYGYSARDMVVRNNHIRGEAVFGVVMTSANDTPSEDLYASGNVLFGNQLAGLNTTVATYYLDKAYDNTIRGYSGTVVLTENAEDNHITGVTPMDGAGGNGDAAGTSMPELPSEAMIEEMEADD